MRNKVNSFIRTVQPYFWQEFSRYSAIGVFAGWISVYYHHFGEVEANLFITWVFTATTMNLAAAFGSYYKHTYQNQRNIYQYLLPGFLILFLLSLQIVRYPSNWPFFSAAYQQAHETILLKNTLPMDFWHFFYMLVLTWRGIRFGREPSSSDVHQKAFIWFFVFFTLLQVLIGSQPPATYQWYFMLILAIGLSGLPAARIVTSSMLRGGRLPKVQREWILAMIIAAIAFTALGVLSSLLLNVSVAKIGSSLLISLFTAIMILVFILLTPFAYGFMFLFDRLIQKLMANAQMPEPNIQSSQEVLNQAQQQTQEIFHQNLLDIQNYLIIAATIAVIVLIWYTLKRQGYQSKKPLSLEEGVIGDKKPPKDRDLHALRDLLNLPGSYDLSAIRIRWIYANLCRYGKQLGNPRLPAVTPFEYQQNLFQLFPEQHIEVAEITSAYVSVRYGQLPETTDEIKKIQESWAILENQARQFLRNNKKLARQAKKKR